MTKIDLRPYLADDRVVQRFWSKVAKNDDQECWLWTGARKPPYGYGQFVPQKGRYVTASRFALALAGDLLDGLQACHRCDNPPCCNPRHLFSGTQTDNNVDCITKGRGNRSRGEAHRSARLTEALVLELRANPRVSTDLVAWADAHGVSRHSAYLAQTRRTWKHLGEPT